MTNCISGSDKSIPDDTKGGDDKAKEKEPADITILPREHSPKCKSDSKVSDPEHDEEDDKEAQDDKASQVNEKEWVGKTKSLKRQTLLIAGYKSIPNIKKDEDDRASQPEENEPAEVTKSPLIPEGKSDPSTTDSEMNENDDIEAQDDKVSQGNEKN